MSPESIVTYGELIAEGTVLSVVQTRDGSCFPDEDNVACPDNRSWEVNLSLSNVWKGPNSRSLTLKYGTCGPTLHVGQKMAFVASQSYAGNWSVNACQVGPLGIFSRTDTDYGRVASPLLNAYRDEGRRVSKAVEDSPTSIDAKMALAAYQVEGSYFDEALATYREVVTLSPKMTAAYLEMARIQLKDKRKPFYALDAVKEGLSHVPDDPNLLKFKRDLGF